MLKSFDNEEFYERNGRLEVELKGSALKCNLENCCC